ncbi:hypothetical protein MMC10_002520 [Thelotrema lepadinum]|nr:hypothetical protein [Thelotrema lepadinum]
MQADRIEENGYGPTPPPEISTLGAPILSNDEYDNNRQFLDFFTTNGPEDLGVLDSFHSLPHDLLPNFQGASSAFGHPDLIQYEHSTSSKVLGSQSRDNFPFAGSTNLFSPKDRDMILTGNEQRILVGDPSLERVLQAYDTPYYALNGHQSQPTSSGFREDSYNKRTSLGFGSDSSFANHHYAPPPGTENIDVVEGRLLETLNSFQPSHSVTNTQPSSPVTTKRKRTLPDSFSVVPIDASPSEDQPNNSELLDARVELQSARDASSPESRKKAKMTQNRSSSPARNQAQRRRSRVTEPKRQNLTEKEKKENHIRSEQKRRNQIKEGFASLLTLMPEGSVEGSSNSKCIVLAKAVDWLTDLRSGNEKLRSQLRLLDATRA